MYHSYQPSDFNSIVGPQAVVPYSCMRQNPMLGLSDLPKKINKIKCEKREEFLILKVFSGESNNGREKGLQQ